MKAERMGLDQGFRYPCLAGSVERGHGDTTYVWALFKRSDVDPDLVKQHEKDIDVDIPGYEDMPYEFDLGMHITGWGPFSRGPGKMFGTYPRTTIGRNHILVVQMRALDI